MIFQLETWESFYPEAADLMEANFREVGENLPYEPDLAGYAHFANRGDLLILTARDKGSIVGYILVALRSHFHSKSTKMAWEEMLYLLPEYRKGLTGYRLIRKMLWLLSQIGVHRLYMDAPPIYSETRKRSLATLYKRLGGTLAASIWVMEVTPKET